MTSTVKHLLVLLAVCTLFGGVYYGLSLTGFFEAGLRTAEDVRAMTDQLEQEILADFAKIDSISIDVSVFSMPGFLALQDTPLIIQPKPVSRDNPFERY